MSCSHYSDEFIYAYVFIICMALAPAAIVGLAYLVNYVAPGSSFRWAYMWDRYLL